MNHWLSLFRALGTAGATANAQAELDVADARITQANSLVERVNRHDRTDRPRPAPVVPRAA